jgi:hypothetical protein
VEVASPHRRLQGFKQLIGLLQNTRCVLAVTALHELANPRGDSFRTSCLVLVRCRVLLRHPSFHSAALPRPGILVPLGGFICYWRISSLALFEFYLFNLIARWTGDPQSLLALCVRTVLI